MIKFLKKLFQGNPLDSEIKTTEQSYLSNSDNETDNEKIVEPGEYEYTQYKTIPIPKVSVIDDPSQREYNKPYRRSGDDANIVRVIQPQPEGTPKKVGEYVSIAGITRNDQNAQKFVSGENINIVLKKDPSNPYDKNAIKVYGNSLIDEEETNLFLGYIPKEHTKKLVKHDTLKATIKTIFFPTETKSYGFRIDIWSKRNQKIKVENKPYDKS